MDARVILGNNIRRLRNSCGMTQEGVAELLGTTKQYVSALETGKQWAGADKIEALCEIFAVSCDEFLLTKERLDALNSMLCQEIQQMDQAQRAQLYARALEINSRHT